MEDELFEVMTEFDPKTLQKHKIDVLMAQFNAVEVVLPVCICNDVSKHCKTVFHF